MKMALTSKVSRDAYDANEAKGQIAHVVLHHVVEIESISQEVECQSSSEEFKGFRRHKFIFSSSSSTHLHENGPAARMFAHIKRYQSNASRMSLRKSIRSKWCMKNAKETRWKRRLTEKRCKLSSEVLSVTSDFFRQFRLPKLQRMVVNCEE